MAPDPVVAGALPAPRQGERRHFRSSALVPVEAKLHAPGATEDFIVREELIDRLKSSSQSIVLLTGPAGAGKTTLLHQWAQQDDRPFTWLTLDESDNDPSTLLTYLLLALGRLGRVDESLMTALSEAGTADPQVIIARLGRALWTWDPPFVLVLDCADNLTSTDALEVVDTLVTHLGEHCQIALAARKAPALRWHRLAQDHVPLRVGIEDLRFSAAESGALLEATGLELTSEDAGAIVERTEGWAAGLYLAAASLRDLGDHRKALDAIAGDDHMIAEYLRDEVFTRLTPEAQTFMTRISILDKMSGPLCDVMLERDNSGSVLREMEQASQFIFHLDRQDSWYRFHQLFADMLRSELQRREARLVPTLHARASRWLEEAGDIQAAIMHAQAAGEIVRAVGLVWTHAADWVGSGRVDVLRSWVDSFTDEQVVTYAKLALAAAWCAIGEGRTAEHWLSAAERGRYDAQLPGETESVAAATALLRAAIAARGVERMGADARLAAQLQAPDDPWRSFAFYLRAVALHLTGHREEAESLLDETNRLAELLGGPAIRARATAQRALMAVEDGDWDRATLLITQANELGVASGIVGLPSQTAVDSVRAMILAKQGRVEEAKALARRSIRTMALITNVPGWVAVQSYQVLGRTYLWLGETEAARSALFEAQKHMSGALDAPTLRHQLDQIWRQIEKTPLAWGSGP